MTGEEMQDSNLLNKNQKNSKGHDNNRRNENSCCAICKRNKKTSIVLGILFGLILLAAIIVLLWFGFGKKQPAEELDLSDLLQDSITVKPTTKDQTLSVSKIIMSINNSSGIANKMMENSNKMIDPTKTQTTETSKIVTTVAPVGDLLDNSPLIGKWELINSTNFDDYMKALGVDWFTRIAANAASSTFILSKNGEKWQLQLISTFKSSDTTFTEGVEYNDKTMDGRKVKTTMRFLNSNKLVQEERDPSSGKLLSLMTREVDSDGQLVATLKAGKVTCLRIYKRIKA